MKSHASGMEYSESHVGQLCNIWKDTKLQHTVESKSEETLDIFKQEINNNDVKWTT